MYLKETSRPLRLSTDTLIRVSGALSKIATFANDGTEVGIVRGTIPLSVNKLNPLGRVPKMLFKLEVLHNGKIGHSWNIAATDDGSKITRALTVGKSGGLRGSCKKGSGRLLAPARNDSEDLLESSDEKKSRKSVHFHRDIIL